MTTPQSWARLSHVQDDSQPSALSARPSHVRDGLQSPSLEPRSVKRLNRLMLSPSILSLHHSLLCDVSRMGSSRFSQI
ncbi:hypothetical protein VNO80_06398 [Phaseolus coccineus]|uniref:Uncharacterized protein n=1 Tax=Phaseolus coccineus TaxID=3886 RepID=A0AAN9NGT7_PHACN